ncbi:MAG TPA: molybdopterin biosynthesis protein [Desulfobacteria bacterium]|nr:molybdopterin biosynthesis protein [Desulfobacteria bacterium]
MINQVFLDNAPLEQTKQNYLNKLADAGALCPKAEPVAVSAAVGRITDTAVRARISSPHYHASAMDGFAVRACDTFQASEATPLRLKLGIDAVVVDTGDPLPVGFDAVIRIEDVSFPAEELIEITLGAVPWQHVRVMGEDLVATEMVLPANHKIRPFDLGALFTAGLTEISVRAKPKVAILPTGTELVEPGTEPLERGDIIEFNSRMLGAMVEEIGGEAVRFPIVTDDYHLLKRTIAKAAAETDFVIVNAGSSAGREDFTAKVIGELGQVFAHGVAIKPGKPVILGMIEDKPVIGLPGYPGSAALTFELFAVPVLEAMLGTTKASEQVTATLTRKLVSPLGVDEFVRVKLGQVGERLMATPLARGAGLVTTLVQADGVIQVCRQSEGFHAGHPVNVELLRPLREILRTIVVIGSHDQALDILGDVLHSVHPNYYLSSAHVGSLGGLLALRRGEAHLAGIHLLDEQTGEYNLAYLAKLLPGIPVKLINLSYRSQGLMVRAGNPKCIRDLRDLTRPDLQFINRQAGSGTRLLLDQKLKQEGLNPDRIQGYAREEFTHMAVAVAVASGAADCGLGVLSAARALGLEFIPVAEERYDLCILQEYLNQPHVQALLAVLESAAFKQRVLALGGYDLRDCGRTMN